MKDTKLVHLKDYNSNSNEPLSSSFYELNKDLSDLKKIQNKLSSFFARAERARLINDQCTEALQSGDIEEIVKLRETMLLTL